MPATNHPLTCRTPYLFLGRMLLFACLAGHGGLAWAQNCTGGPYIQLSSQTAVNAFQANFGPCTRVTGSIDIEDFQTPGNRITDLTPLSALTEVVGTMWVSNTLVTSLAGLDNLASAGTLSINGNPSLTSLSALENLASLQSLGLSGNTSLASLAGLPNLLTLQSLDVWGNTSLTSLAGWTALASLSGLQNLAIGENSLTSLGGLPNLTSLVELRLGEANLSGLPGTLSQVDTLEFTGGLPGINGLSNGLQVRELRVSGTTTLASLDGLPALTVLEELFIGGNEQLTDLGGLAASSFSQANVEETSVRISENFDLEDLTGIPTPARLGYLEVYFNGNLRSLAGLAGLQEMWGSLQVFDNDKLSDCESLRTVLDEVDDGDPGPGTSMDPDDPPDTLYGLLGITIENNLGYFPDLPPGHRGCDSIEEILSTDSDVIHQDGFEGG